MGDLLGFWRGRWINIAVRHLGKMVPEYRLPLDRGRTVTRFAAALAEGGRQTIRRPAVSPDDVAFLQYTGGTTGVSKGAVLLHRNQVAYVLQSEAWNRPALTRVEPGEQVHVVCALPLFHVFGFTCCLMLGLRIGACNILIPNPRDIGALLKELARHRFHSFPAVREILPH